MPRPGLLNWLAYRFSDTFTFQSAQGCFAKRCSSKHYIFAINLHEHQKVSHSDSTADLKGSAARTFNMNSNKTQRTKLIIIKTLAVSKRWSWCTSVPPADKQIEEEASNMQSCALTVALGWGRRWQWRRGCERSKQTKQQNGKFRVPLPEHVHSLLRSRAHDSARLLLWISYITYSGLACVLLLAIRYGVKLLKSALKFYSIHLRLGTI